MGGMFLPLISQAHYPVECQGGVVGPGGVSPLHWIMVPALGSRTRPVSALHLRTYRWPLAINGQRLETDVLRKVSG